MCGVVIQLLWRRDAHVAKEFVHAVAQGPRTSSTALAFTSRNALDISSPLLIQCSQLCVGEALGLGIASMV